MKRLVYSPRAEAYIKSDYGTIDVSPYIVRGAVQRKLDQVSTSQVTIRNPDFKFTEHNFTDSLTKQRVTGPMFHPMDPITVVLTRLHDHPIQVFTGYLDSTPYYQLFPGTITLTASCTLKRLLYTYFDPGLTFFNEYLNAHGWQTVEGMGIVSKSAPDQGQGHPTSDLTDTGFGDLLFNILQDVGHWDDKDVYIEALPDGLIELLTKLVPDALKASEEAQKESNDFLHRIIGTGAQGLAGGSQSGHPAQTGGGSGSGTVAASWFDGATCADRFGFAELSNNYGAGASGCDFSALGDLPKGTKLRCTRNNKTITVTKTDVGCGGPGIGDHKRAIDFCPGAAAALGLTSAGVGLVDYEVLGK